MTLYKINPLRFQKIPLTIKNYPWPRGSKLWSKLFISSNLIISWIHDKAFSAAKNCSLLSLYNYLLKLEKSAEHRDWRAK